MTSPDLTPVQAYAIAMIIDAAMSVAEDDLNEDGELSDTDHQAACDLAMAILSGMRANPPAVLAFTEAAGDDR